MGKSAFHDPQPENQAKRMMLNKWRKRPDDAVSSTPGAAIATKFHETFVKPLSSSKKAAMRELFPMRGARWATPAAESDCAIVARHR